MKNIKNNDIVKYKKIALFVDPLMGKGGGSRVAVKLANYLNADIVTSGFNPELRKDINPNLKVIDIGNYFINKNYSFGFLFEAPIRFLLCKEYDYDLNIFIGNFSIFASRKNRQNIWFCFSPNRIMYDLREWKFKHDRLYKRFFYTLHILLFRGIDQHVVKNNFVEIIAQTEHVQQRIKKYYSMDSKVIFSPIDTSVYRFDKFGDYYLTVARLIPEKRIDLIVEAFIELPNKKLIIVGDGPEIQKIKRLIKNYPNIKLMNSVDDKELISLYAGCFATIYLPLAEDFGLVPIEGMASGKACIAANEGGCLETVVNNKTGLLIDANKQSLIKALNRFNINTARKMKNDCIAHAKKFDIRTIHDQWIAIINGIN